MAAPQPVPSGVTAPRRGNTAMGIATTVAVHGLLAAAILGAAWTISGAKKRKASPVVLTADFFHPAPARAASRAGEQRDEDIAAQRAAARRDPDAPAPDLAERLRAIEAASAPHAELDALARRFGADSAAASEGAPISRAGASFAGLVAGNATKVAYVVDASGSMIGSFPQIVDEVERSIARLEPTQRFTVVCFRRDGAVSPGGTSALRPASRDERAKAVSWLRNGVVPSGRSSPIEALSRALASGADCVFLLSTTVTGPGRHELDRDALLALLERLNPRDPETGRRRATIQCIQFLERDPGGALEAVASEHFGPGGFRYISREDTGLDPPAPASVPAGGA